MGKRFFVSGPLAAGEVSVEGAEFDHMTSVMRLCAGDSVVLLDGSGSEADAVIVSTAGRRAVLSAGEVRRMPLRETVEIATALPKGRRAKWLVGKCTELGARGFHFIDFRRSSVRKLGAEKLSGLEAAAREAVKQCGRHFVPFFRGPESLDDFLSGPLPTARIVLDPAAGEPLKSLLPSRGREGTVVVAGPEGGFGPGEIEKLAGRGFRTALLSGATLRIETACLAALAVFEAMDVGT